MVTAEAKGQKIRSLGKEYIPKLNKKNGHSKFGEWTDGGINTMSI